VTQIVSSCNNDAIESNSIDLNSLAILAALLAVAIAKGRTTDEINIIGNFFGTLGTALTLLGSQPENDQSQTLNQQQKNPIPSDQDIQQQINQLKTQIEQLEQKITNSKK